MWLWRVWSFAFLVSAGCSKSAPEPGKVASIENVCNEPDGARVRLTGTLRYPRALLSFCSTQGSRQTCDLALYAGSEKPADFNIMRPRSGPEPVHVKLSLSVGDEPGEMAELPKKFSASDVALHLPNGAKAGDGTRVTVDGTLQVIAGDLKTPAGSRPRSCWVDVDWAAPP